MTSSIRTHYNDAITYVQTSRPYQGLAYVGNKIQELATKVLDTVMPKNEMTKRREFRFIPTCVENFLGNVSYDGVCPRAKICQDSDLTNRVTAVFNKLVEKCPRKSMNWEIRVMQDDDTVNAFCLPGGKVVITTGMIKKLAEKIDADDSEPFNKLTMEDHLAAVLGHEIVHAAAGHGARKMQLLMIVFLAGKICSYVIPNFLFKKEQPKALPANVEEERKIADEAREIESKKAAFREGFDLVYSMGSYLFGQHHSQCHELESDKYGIKLAHDAGYNIRAAERLMHVFLKMKGQVAGEKMSGLEKGLELFSTHPCSNRRLDENVRTIEAIEKDGAEAVFA